MYDEGADGLLSLFLLHHGVVAAEEFHCKPVVCHLEHGPQLLAEVDRCHVGLCFVLPT